MRARDRPADAARRDVEQRTARGTERIALFAAIDTGAKLLGALVIFLLVRQPEDGWLVLAASACASLISTSVGYALVLRNVRPRGFGIRLIGRTLRFGFSMFVLRVAVMAHSSGNAFLLGLLAQTFGDLAVAVAHYEGAVDADLRLGARPAVALARLGWAECLAREPALSAGHTTSDLARLAADEGVGCEGVAGSDDLQSLARRDSEAGAALRYPPAARAAVLAGPRPGPVAGGNVPRTSSRPDQTAAPTIAPMPDVTAIARAPQITTLAVAVSRRPPPSRAPV